MADLCNWDACGLVGAMTALAAVSQTPDADNYDNNATGIDGR